jgi:hypothetical protein
MYLPERSEENHDNLSQDSPYPRRDLNSEPPKYKRMLTTLPRRSVQTNYDWTLQETEDKEYCNAYYFWNHEIHGNHNVFGPARRHTEATIFIATARFSRRKYSLQVTNSLTVTRVFVLTHMQ